jgi:beta-galactosidase
MYPRRAQIERLAAAHPDRPVVLCEYAHSMGNSTGNIGDYWALFQSHPRCQGGFIWDWVDQALLVTERHGAAEPFLGYGGDFGDPIHDAQFCCNGLVFPHRQPHPALAEVSHVQAPLAITGGQIVPARSGGHDTDTAFQVTIENRHDFVALGHVTLEWRLLADGMPVPRGGPDAVLHGQAQIPRDTYAQVWQLFQPSTDLLVQCTAPLVGPHENVACVHVKGR